ncbi:uncharacterized protein N7477_009022 [Penicillium maclennaniae]|uniref:uncharacterized protein n=1 Tax=Penicillium maclennaniae TaxID=1343394 RepID=UPI002540BBE7|nr:uncharacterized protein N7477_009022 [Penicillium maclennaniae]KAJ5661406.1 hypothetical protein N7477_009022 [Penicillium maclennaniae]
MWSVLEPRRAGSGEAEEGYCDTVCGQHWYSTNDRGFAMLSHEVISNAMMDLTAKYMQTSEGVA